MTDDRYKKATHAVSKADEDSDSTDTADSEEDSTSASSSAVVTDP